MAQPVQNYYTYSTLKQFSAQCKIEAGYVEFNVIILLFIKS